MDISTPHPALPSVATPSVLPSDAPTDGLSAWADIDLDAIRGNVARLGELAGDADVMAVIKGDAYGHGLVPVAGAALAGGATYLGIAQLGEAMAARAAGVTAPILTWLFPPGADLAAAVNDVAADKKRAAEFGRAGRERAIRDFSWATIAAQTVDIYRSLI